MIDRRQFIAGSLAVPLLGAATGVYAVGVEPNLFLQVRRYALTIPDWTAGLNVRLAVLTDIQATCASAWISFTDTRCGTTAT